MGGPGISNPRDHMKKLFFAFLSLGAAIAQAQLVNVQKTSGTFLVSNVNSITSAATQDFILATGTSGTAVTFTSATNHATFTGTGKFPAGAAGDPAVAFPSSNGGMGFYWLDDSGIEWAVAGQRILSISDHGLNDKNGLCIVRFSLGALGAPTYSWTADPTSGMWSDTGSLVNFSRSGTLVGQFNATGFLLPPGSITAGASTNLVLNGGSGGVGPGVITIPNNGGEMILAVTGGAGVEVTNGGTNYFKGTSSGWDAPQNNARIRAAASTTDSQPVFTFTDDTASGVRLAGGSNLRILRSGVAEISITSGLVSMPGSVSLTTAGKTISIKSGSNAAAGTFTMVAGSATVTSTAITTGMTVTPTLVTVGGTAGIYTPLVVVSAGSFTATSIATDTSTYNWTAIIKN